MTNVPLKEIINAVSQLDAYQLIKYTAGLKVADRLSKKGLDFLEERIEELWCRVSYKKEFGFTPTLHLAKSINSTTKSNDYIRFKQCVGKHWSLGLIKVGLYLMDLTQEGQHDLINQIKSEMSHRYPKRAMKVINIASSGALPALIAYISSIQLGEELSPQSCACRFEEFLDNWDKMTVWVKQDMSKEEVDEVIMSKIVSEESEVLVFAIGEKAKISAAKAIANLNNDRIFRKNKYMWSLFPKRNTVGVPIFVWAIHKFK